MAKNVIFDMAAAAILNFVVLAQTNVQYTLISILLTLQAYVYRTSDTVP